MSGIVESIDTGVAGAFRPPWDTVQAGAEWSITYKFDRAAPDSDPSESFGNYDTAVSTFTIRVGGVEVSRAETEGDAAIVVLDDSMGVDQYGGIFGWIEENVEVDFIQQFIDLQDPQGQVFSSDALPESLDLNDFGGPNTFFIRFEKTNARIQGTITGIDDSPPPLGILCPADVVAPCEDSSGAVVNFPTPTLDPLLGGCGSVTITCSPPPGQFPIGATRVLCSAVDRCGQIATCSFTVTVQGKEAEWAHARRDGQDVQELGNGIAIDLAGNVYVVGTFSSFTTFTDPFGAPVTLTSAGGSDVFLAKFDQGLNLLWVTSAGGALDDDGLEVATDGAGNAYIVGSFQGTAVFNSVSGPSPPPLVSAGVTDGFLVKFDPNGAALWAKAIGGAGSDSATDVDVDSQDHPYLTGYFQQTIGIPLTGFGLALTSQSSDCFVVKWDQAGAFAHWAFQTGSDTIVDPASAAFGRGIAVSAPDAVFVTGEFVGTVAFPFSPTPVVTGGPSNTMFAARCGISGGSPGFAWVNHSGGVGSAGAHDGRAIDVDGQGNVYATGYFNGTAAFAGASVTRGPGLYDYLVVRFDAGTGAAAWAAAGGGLATVDTETRDIAVDAAGDIYITGFDGGTSLFDPAAKDVVVRKYDANGSLKWTRDATGSPLGGTPPDDNAGHGIAVGPDGCIYVTGGFNERLLFGSSLLLDGYNDQTQDVFVGKLCPRCCPEVTRECAECSGKDGPLTFTYRFRLHNPTTDTIGNVTLIPESPAGLTFAPDHFTVFLPPGQTINLETTLQGAPECSRICFRIAMHTSDWREICTTAHCFDLPHCCRAVTYTTTADFNKGVLLNLLGANDELKFASKITPFPYVNIACSDRGTLVRIHADTGRVLGEYLTAPDGMGGNPSRTTVDKWGNVWVANRDEVGLLSGVRRGSVTRVALVIGGTRGRKSGTAFVHDPDGEYLRPPFLYNSGAIDRDGDGLIKTSRGLGDILPWEDPLTPNVLGAQPGDSGASWAEDELVVTYSRPDAFAIRTLAVDCENDLWVGGYGFHGPPDQHSTRAWIGSHLHQKLDGESGTPIAATSFVAPSLGGGYGGVMDSRGILWSAGDAKGTLRFNTTLPFNAGSNPLDLGRTCGNYGLSIDPCTGFVWHASLGPNPGDLAQAGNGARGRVYVRDALTGTCVYPPGYGHGYNYAQGVAVDQAQNVWVAHSKAIGSRAPGATTAITTVGHIKTSGTYVGNVSLKGGAKDGQGPTGVAVDSNHNIWVTCYWSDNVKRIDPNAGPVGGGNSRVGLMVGEVDLNAAAWNSWRLALHKPEPEKFPDAGPYNYSDMTGFGFLASTCSFGMWSVVHDVGCGEGHGWGAVSWRSQEPIGTGITVEIRAADQQVDLPQQPFRQALNGISFCDAGVRGRFLEIRVLFTHPPNCSPITPALLDLTVECCPETGACLGNSPPEATGCPNDQDLSFCLQEPQTFNINVSDRDGDPLTVEWCVDGISIETDSVPGTTFPPTQGTASFTHLFSPGSHWVEAKISDGTTTYTCRFWVYQGDAVGPTTKGGHHYSQTAFRGSIPAVTPDLVADNCSSPESIVISGQDPAPGTAATQGGYTINFTATDEAGNSTEHRAFLVIQPVIAIASPANYASFDVGEEAPVSVSVAPGVADVAKVRLYLEDVLVGESELAPFDFVLSGVQVGAYSLRAEAENAEGVLSVSQSVLVTFKDASNSCPEGATRRIYSAGIPDEGSDPAETAFPGGCLQTKYPQAPYKAFDDPTVDRFVGHTFVGLPPNIVGAQLRVRMRPSEFVDASNDTINLGLLAHTQSGCGAEPTGYAWASAIESLPGAGGAWNDNFWTTFTFDLAQLPSNAGGAVLGKLASDRFLDVLVQDDTVVDWMELVVDSCGDSGVGGTGNAHDLLGLAQVQAGAGSALWVSGMGESGEDGVAFDLGQAAGWEAFFEPVEFADGAYLEAGFLGGGAAADGDLMALLRVESLPDGRSQVLGQFPGADAVDLEFYLGGDQVGDETLDTTLGSPWLHLFSALLVLSDLAVDRDDGADFATTLTFMETDADLPDGGGSVRCDRVVIRPQRPAGQFDYLERVELRAAGIPVLSVLQERLRMSGAGLEPWGGAALGAGPGGVSVSALDGLQDAGVRLDLNGAGNSSVEIAVHGAADGSPGWNDSGDLLGLDALGTVDGIPGQMLSRLVVIKGEPDDAWPYTLLIGPAPPAGTSYRASVWRNGILVAERAIVAPLGGGSSSPPVALGRVLGEQQALVARFPADTSLFLGQDVFQGDELRILDPPGAGRIDALNSFTLTATGIPGFTVTGIALSDLTVPDPPSGSSIGISGYAPDGVRVEWMGEGWLLQSSPDQRDWTDLPGAESPYPVDPEEAWKYFRLRYPGAGP